MSIYAKAAILLLAVFVISLTVSGFLFGLGFAVWPGFLALAIGCLVASYLIGSN